MSNKKRVKHYTDQEWKDYCTELLSSPALQPPDRQRQRLPESSAMTEKALVDKSRRNIPAVVAKLLAFQL